MDVQHKKDMASWLLDGEIVKITVTHLHQAIFDSVKNAVIVLSGVENEPNKISIYSIEGRHITDIAEPDKCHFNYLGSNRGHVVAVMATVYLSGWKDWWYAIDIKAGDLVSLGEGR